MQRCTIFPRNPNLTARAGLPAHVFPANTAEGQQRWAGLQEEEEALRRADGVGREEGDSRLCRAGWLGGVTLWATTGLGGRVSCTNSHTLYD